MLKRRQESIVLYPSLYLFEINNIELPNISQFDIHWINKSIYTDNKVILYNKRAKHVFPEDPEQFNKSITISWASFISFLITLYFIFWLFSQNGYRSQYEETNEKELVVVYTNKQLQSNSLFFLQY